MKLINIFFILMPTYLENPVFKASFFNDFYKGKECKIRIGKFQQLDSFTESNHKEKQKLIYQRYKSVSLFDHLIDGEDAAPMCTKLFIYLLDLGLFSHIPNDVIVKYALDTKTKSVTESIINRGYLNPDNVNSIIIEGKSVLAYSCMFGSERHDNLTDILTLFEMGAKLTDSEKSNNIPEIAHNIIRHIRTRYWNASVKHKKSVVDLIHKLIVSFNVDVNITATYMFYSVQMTELCDHLFEKYKIDVNAKNSDGKTFLAHLGVNEIMKLKCFPDIIAAGYDMYSFNTVYGVKRLNILGSGWYETDYLKFIIGHGFDFKANLINCAIPYADRSNFTEFLKLCKDQGITDVNVYTQLFTEIKPKLHKNYSPKAMIEFQKLGVEI